MANKVLITYASRAGSTAGVAEFIGKTLTESGLEVEVLSMQDVQDLSPYQAVVAGSAIQRQKWLPEATRFIQRHKEALARKPVATFMVCMTLAMKNEQWREEADVEAWLDPVRRVVHPVSEGYFAGALDISKIPSWVDRVKFRVSVMLGIWSEGDHRDWAKIEAWARALPAKLQ